MIGRLNWAKGPRRWVWAAHALPLLSLMVWAAATISAAAEADVATRLVMVEEVGCRFCAAWDRDVGENYAASSEGRFAPLVRVKRQAPELKDLQPATYTPTFILVQGRTEVGRITGYPGPHYFWVELDDLLAKAGFEGTREAENDPG